MIFSFPSVSLLEEKLEYSSGKYCQIPSCYKKKTNIQLINDFYSQLLNNKKGCCEPEFGQDPLGFDYMLLDYICYIGIIFISGNSSIKNKNKKKYPDNKFPQDYIINRIREEYDLLNLNKFIPVKNFTQSIHELRGLNSKISGHIDKLMKFSTEEEWESQFESADENLKKIYVGTRLIKFLLDNIRFFNPQNISNLDVDKSFTFIIHRSINKIVKIYRNDFTADKAEIEFKGNSFRKLRGEKEYFEILIKILVENALKFSTDKRIGPKIWIKELDKKTIQIGVESYGRLIPFEERDDIFTRGYRSDVHRGVRGTGMGLFIAKNLAEFYDIKIVYIGEEISEDKSIKLGWNKFLLTCNDTLRNGQ
jgi:two-component system sensor histidine kinase ArlS